MFFWSWILIQNILVQYCQSQAFRNHESDTKSYETGWHFKFKKKASFALLFLVYSMVSFLSFCWQPWKQTLNQCIVLLFWMQLHCYVILDFSSSGTKKTRCCMTSHKNHPIWQQVISCAVIVWTVWHPWLGADFKMSTEMSYKDITLCFCSWEHEKS